MCYTHVIVTMNTEGKNKSVIHAEADLNESFVVENIIKPYVNGEPLFVDGARSCAENIQKITVYQSEIDSLQLIEEENSRLRNSSARDKANRIFTRNPSSASLINVLNKAPSINITRKVFNQALGIEMISEMPAGKHEPSQ
jgi:hypothetical protein